MHGTDIVFLDSVSKWYGKNPGILECSLKIPAGKITALIGKNGAGKTTAMKLIMGFLRPTAGRIVIGGKPRNLLTTNQSVGYLPENLRFAELYSVGQFFESLAGIRGLRYKEVASYIEMTRDVFELQPHWKKTLGSCSKGTRQKVGIVQAFMHNPELVVLDEPTNGLDPAVRHNFFQFLQQRKNQGGSILISSHNLQEVERQADNYVFFHNSKVIETVKATDLKEGSGTHVLFDGTVPPAFADKLASINASIPEPGKVIVEQAENLNEVLALLIGAGLAVKNVLPEHPILENYFLDMLAEGSEVK